MMKMGSRRSNRKGIYISAPSVKGISIFLLTYIPSMMFFLLIKYHHKGKSTTGFFILGMHRSGTSMLSGLLIEGFGYHTGEPLLPPHSTNEKGFYELIPFVNQNDAFMLDEGIYWHSATIGRYEDLKEIKLTEDGVQTQKILNDPTNVPWLLKDPRICITLRSWLPLINSKPAAVFTYRHPLEVAMSLEKRESGHFCISRGLRAWVRYNKAAVLNSSDLCVVRSSNKAILKDPLNETKRIARDLTTKCGVPEPPFEITQDIADGFVDPALQHNKLLKKNNAANQVLKIFSENCVARDFISKETINWKRLQEVDVYLKAMKIYCDMESGDAFEKDYIWPEI